MTDHPRLTRYIPGLINGTFTGMLRGSGPTLYGPECDSTRGPYVLASEADAEIDRLRAEVERLTGERDEARKPPHCINCHCEESAKGMVDLSDYLDLHRGLMAVVYESKSHAEAVLFSERALRHAESEHVISEAASSATAPNSFADQNRALVAEVANRRGITLGHLREDGGGELAQIMRRLDEAETHVERLRAALEIAAKRFDYIAAGASREIANPVTGAAAARASAQQPNEHMSAAVEAVAAAPKRAYYETHEPPHCPTCGCER